MNYTAQFKQFLSTKKSPASKATIKNYASDVNRFIVWFEAKYDSPFDPKEVDELVLNSFETDNLTTYSPRSVARNMSSIRKFFTFLKLDSQISHNPFETIAPKNFEKQSDPWRIKDFKNYLYVLNASPLTIKNYITDINQFKTWVENDIKIDSWDDSWDINEANLLEKLNSDLINKYKDRMLKEMQLSPVSVNRKLSSLRRYTLWLKEQGFIRQDIEVLNNPRLMPILPIPLSSPKKSEKTPVSTAKTYSKFPPLRLVQKMHFGLGEIFDLLIITQLAKIMNKADYAIWNMKGNPIFEKSSQKKTAIASGKTSSGLRDVKNVPKSKYAPTKISTANFPIHRKILHKLRYSRPGWYRKYHSFIFTSYFHFAILMFVASLFSYILFSNLDNNKHESQKNVAVLGAVPSAPNRILSFQGKLTDTKSNPINDTTLLRMSIYSNEKASGSALLWQEVNRATPDKDGIFNLVLGRNTPIPQSVFSQNSALWLGVTVEQTSELTPRQPIATVAFASNAETLQGLPPITGSNDTANVVLSLNSSGNLTIGGTSSPVFQATGGTFTISGRTLLLTTTESSNGNVVINPNGSGSVDIQKVIKNTTNNGTLPGAVQIDDVLLIKTSTTSQAALNINQESTGNLIDATTNLASKFKVDNAGNLTASGSINGLSANSGVITSGTWNGNTLGTTYGGTGLTSYSTGDLIYSPSSNTLGKLSIGMSGYCLVSNGSIPTWTTCSSGNNSVWNEAIGAIFPINSDSDFLLGGNSTNSAKFAILNVNTARGNQIASLAGSFVLDSSLASIQTTDLQTLTIGGSTTGDIIFDSGSGTISFTDAPTFSSFSVDGGILYADATGALVQTASAGNLGECLVSNGGGTPGWSSCSGVGGTNWNISTGAISPKYLTVDLLLGSAATSSSKFAFINSGSTSLGVPTASISANSGNNATYISGDGTLGTTNNQTLTLGGSTTGNVSILENTSISGDLSINSFTTDGGLIYTNASGTFQQIASTGTNTLCLLGNATGAPSWGACLGDGVGENLWQLGTGTLTQGNLTNEVLFGAQATVSAKFAFLNSSSTGTGTPIASISANSGNNATYLAGDGTLGTTNRQTLIIGNSSSYDTSGNVLINPNGVGNIGIGTSNIANNGRLTVNGGVYANWYGDLDDGSYYLNPSEPTNSLLVAGNVGIGTLTPTAKLDVIGTASIGGQLTFRSGSGSIQTTANETLTIGGNTTGNIVLFGFGNGIVKTNTNGVLSSSAIDLASTEVSGTLADGNISDTLTIGSLGSVDWAALTSYPSGCLAGSAVTGVGDLLSCSSFLTAEVDGVIGNEVTNTTNSTLTRSGAGTSGDPYTLSLNLGNSNVWTGLQSFNAGITSTGARTGQALVALDETGDQDILTASAGGSTVFNLGKNGNVTQAGDLTVTGGDLTIGTSVAFIDTVGSLQLSNVDSLDATTKTTIEGAIDTLSSLSSIGSNDLTNLTFNIDTAGNYIFQKEGVVFSCAGTDKLTLNGSGNLVCATDQSGGGSGTNYWQLGTGTLTQGNLTNEVLFGAQATVSAKFAFLNSSSTGTGTPIASISANSGNNATYLAGDGTLGTTNAQTLNIGSASTGNIIIDSGSGSINLPDLTQNGGILYTNGSGTLLQTNGGGLGECLISNGSGTPDWGPCSGTGGSNWNISAGLISPKALSVDFALGASTTTSAKFAVLNILAGTPTASISANSGDNSTYLSGLGVLGTTNKQTLALGSPSTGNVVLYGFGAGIIHSDANGVLTSSAINLGSSDVTGTLTDANVSDTLTSSNFVGTGSTSNAVDLGTSEVSGTLADGNVSDTITISSLGSVDWAALGNYPTACTAGSAVTGVGDLLSCSSFLTAEVDGVIGNEVTNVTNSTLTRSGAGTSGDPYTLALNLGNANTWTSLQSFNGGLSATGAREGQALVQLNETGNQDILTASASGATVFTIDRTGTITTGVWGGTSLTDANVSDTLTSSNFVGTGSTSNAVDLGTSEVSGTLADGNVSDTITISSLGSVDWAALGNYPTACTAGSAVTGVGDLLSCSSFLTAEVDGVIGNEVTNVTNSTLTRSGAGTNIDPYTLALNLGNANTWTSLQSFNGGLSATGAREGQALVQLNETGNQDILTASASGATVFTIDRTGTITTGVWGGTSLTDANVSDTLTSSNFVGTGSTSNAVDLGTSEVSGTLADGNVSDTITISSLGSVDWAALGNYPTACTAGSAVTGVGDLLSCSSFLTAEVDGVIGNEVTNVTNSTLTRSGAGTNIDPYTLALNLGNANTWTSLQSFNGGLSATGAREGQALVQLNETGNQDILTASASGATVFTIDRTGTITTGVWGGTSLTDANVSDTLTSSNFVGTGSTSNAVDLGTSEVSGTLADGNVSDTITISSLGSVDWAALGNYPTACTAGSAVTGVGDLLSCSSFLTAEVDGVIGNEVTNVTNSTLTRSGAGTNIDPYTLALNLGNANTWTSLQSFNGGLSATGAREGQALVQLNETGNQDILTASASGATVFTIDRTGTITTGVWGGTSLTDANVSDTLTSSNFVGTGSTSNAVDLGTSEVSGTLADGNVSDTITISSLGSVDWAALGNYPTACTAGSAVTGVGDLLSCSSFLTAEVDGVIGNEVTNVTNSTLTRSGAGTNIDPYTLALNLGNANTWTSLQSFNGGLSATGAREGQALVQLNETGNQDILTASASGATVFTIDRTGTITTGVWGGTSLTDANVSDTLTSSNFVGTGSTSNAVDLGTSEVSGTLADGNVSDTITISSLGSVDWAALGNYPTACTAGSAVTGVGDLLSCSSFLTAEVDGVIGNEVTNVTNSTLTRSGAGTNIDPYTLALNLGNANTWTSLQSFNGGLSATGAREGQALVQLNETGNQDILTASASGATVFTIDRTGTITTGVWGGTSLTDANVSDTLTSSNFVGTGSTSNAVDLGTSEVSGTLADGNVSDTITISSLGSVDWAALGNYPTACTAGSAVTGVGDLLSCSSFLTAEVDGVIGNEVTNVTNSTLTRSGAGTSGDPYTLSLNLGNSNVWTGLQSFNAGITSTGARTGQALVALDETGDQDILTASASGATVFTIDRTGTITTGVWGGTSLTDANVSDTLTSSNFVGTGSTSNAVDLGTSEVSGTLADSNISDTLTIGSLGSVDWAALTSYPSGCLAGSAVTGVGDSLTCSSFLVSETDGVIGNEVTNVTNSTLTRSGAGTSGDPYTLSLNLGNSNVWTGLQSFNAGITSTGARTGQALVALDETGDQDILTASASGATVFTIDRTGTITTGVWGGTSLTDANVSDTLTSSNFVGTGSTSNAVDLGTSEVSGTLADGNVSDTITISSLGSVDWAALGNYPTACTAGSAVTGVGDLLSCSSFLTAEVDGVIGNEVTNVTNSTLTRSGAGTNIDPYTLALNLGNANTWTSLQSFNGGLSATGAREGQALVQLNETGNQDILTASASGATVFTIDRTGTITTGVWGGTSLTDANVSDTLTSSNFVGTGSTSNAVDLGTSEVSGTLADGNVSDTITISSLGSVDWAALGNYPTACTAGSAVTGVGDLLSCSSFLTAEVDGVIGNEVTNVTNSTLTRSGAGTNIDPYTLALNLGNANTWTSLQSFNGGLSATGAREGQALVQLNETGNQDILTASASGATVFTIDRTGTITTGVWGGTSLTDANVSDTLTSSNFVGTGSTSNAVDLGTSEVSGTLADGNVSDTITISSLGSVDWAALGNYPTACTAGSAVTGVGDLLSCSSFLTAEVDGVIGNEVTNVTNSTLTRSGAGTNIDPYTLALNLGNANTWTSLQSFNGGLSATGAREGQALVQLNETGNQDILTASASGATVFTLQKDGDVVQTGDLTISGGNLTVGISEALFDNSGALELKNLDSLDSTTETTIESAIDTLNNLGNIGSGSLASLTVSTDGTGDSEVILPNQSIGASELLDNTIDFTKLASAQTLDEDTTLSLNTYNYILDLTSTGEFYIRDAGNNFAQFLADGTITLGKAASNSTLNLGIGDGSDSIYIGTSNTAGDTIQIGNNNTSTTLSLTGGDDWSITNAGAASFTSFMGAGLSDCDSATSKLLWNDATGTFSCGTDMGSNLQVQSFTDTTSETATFTVVMDIWDGTYPNITPGATSSNILVSVNIRGVSEDGNDHNPVFTIRRAIDSNPTCSSTQVGGEFVGGFLTTTAQDWGASVTFSDAPSSTGNVRYTVCTTTTGLDDATTSEVTVVLTEIGSSSGGGGSGNISVRESDGSPSVASASTIEFGPGSTSSDEFIVTDEGSGVARIRLGNMVGMLNQAETVTGGWTFNTASATFATSILANGGLNTSSNADLNLAANGSGDITLGADFDSAVLIGSSPTPAPLSVRGGYGSNAAFILDQLNIGDIFSASASGTTLFTIDNAGAIGLLGDYGTSGQCLQTNEAGSAASWGDCSASAGVWNLDEGNGILTPINNTVDLLIGGNATSSAKFAILNLSQARGNQIASLSGNLVLDHTASITTTKNQTLTLGGESSGNIILDNSSTKLIFSGFTNNNNSIVYAGSLGALNVAETTGNGECLLSNSSGTPDWGTCPSGAGGSQWTLDSGNGVIYPNQASTLDVLIGGTGTISAKFAFINVAEGTPTASISANTGNSALFFDANGNIQTSNGQTLTLGGGNSGNIALSSNLVLSADANEGISGGGLSNCNTGATDKLLWNASTNKFSCGTDQGGSGGSLTVQEQDLSPSVSAVTTLQFGPATTSTDEFIVNDQDSGIALVRIGNQVAMLNQAETIIGGWTFNTTDTTFTSGILANGGITTTSETDLTLTADATGNILLLADFDSGVLIGSTSTNASLSVAGSYGSNAALIVDQLNNGNIFTASASGTTQFTIASNGDITTLGDLAINGDNLTSDEDLTINAAGGNILSSNALNIGGAGEAAYNFFASSTAGNTNADGAGDLYIQDELEVDGAIFADSNLTVAGTTGISLTGSGADLLFANLERVSNDTNGTITLGRNDAGVVTLNAADDDSTAAFTIESGGDAILTLDTGSNGTSGISIGTTNANSVTIGNTDTGTALTFDTGTGGINIGNNANTKSINIGGNNATDGSDTVRISTDASSADTINIGNANSSTTIALTGGDDWSITNAGAATFATFQGAGLSGDCDTVNSKLLWDTTSKTFSCGTDDGVDGVTVDIFTSGDTWTKADYTGLTFTQVITTGGGGGGGGVAGVAADTTTEHAGGGGGGGGTAIEIIPAGSLGTTETVTVGTGGSAGAAGGNGGAGNSSSFGSHNSANGGGLGTGRAANGNACTVALDGGAGGTGGTATGGDINLTGGDGGNGKCLGEFAQGGDGGSTYWGIGGLGAQDVANSANSGNSGSAYGAGGGGGREEDSQDITNGTGAAGTNGVVLTLNYKSSAGDLAEWYDTQDGVEMGDVVAVSNESMSYDATLGLQTASVLKKATKGDSVVGVISSVPNDTIGGDLLEGARRPRPLALAGRVPVKVSEANGKIKAGDLLTASSTPGVAMKSTKAGSVLGKALANSNCTEGSTCTVLVLVNTSYSTGALTKTALRDQGLDIETIPGDIDLERDISKATLAYLIQEKENIIDDQKVSEVYTDRIAAGLEVVTPRITTDEIAANIIMPVDDDLSIVLNDSSKLTIGGSQSADIEFDNIGNATFSGTLIANQLKSSYAELGKIIVETATILSANIVELSTDSLVVTSENITIAGINIRDYIYSIVEQRISNKQIAISSPILEADQIKPSSGKDIAIILPENDSKLIIENASSSAVAYIDEQGNASFSGNLSSNSLQTNDASISGTLRADRIIANQIDLSEEALAKLTGVSINASPSANYVTNNYYYDATQSANLANIPISSYSANLNSLIADTGTFTNGLMSYGTTSFYEATIAERLFVGSQLSIADHSINVLGSDLQIQSLKQGGVAFVGGEIKIDVDGNLKVNGNAQFAKDVDILGKLSAGIIAIGANKNLIFEFKESEGVASNIEFKTGTGSAVLSFNNKGDINSSGSGTFSKINLNIIPDAIAVSDTEIIASGSAGTADIKPYQNELTIRNPLVTKNSLIYITAKTNLADQSVYLLRQIPGESFTVGLSKAISKSVPFNWILIN